MKKSLLVLIPSVLLVLSACSNNGGGSSSVTIPTIPSSTAETSVPPPPSQSEAPKHAERMNLDPAHPFYLRVGDMSSVVKAGLDPTPSDPAEATFRWSTSNDEILGITPSEDTKSVVLNAKALGKATISCTNIWNELDPKFTKTVEVSVVEAGKNVYIWEYAGSSELAQFGYNRDTNPTGNASGDATLGALKWHYERSVPSTMRSDSGAICFGKKAAEGETTGPEGQIVLTNSNTRKVKRIGVECSSQDGSSKLTVKVGDTSFIDENTTGQVVNHDSGEVATAAEGNISIKFSPSNGSIHLKSIIVFYENVQEELFETTFDLINGSAKDWSGSSYDPRQLSEEKAVIDFDGAKYGAIGQLEPATNAVTVKNGLVRISSAKADEVIDHVTAKFVQHATESSKAAKTVKGYASYYGKAYFDRSATPISEVSIKADSPVREFALSVEPISDGNSAICLDPSSNSNTFYITEIKVYTKVGTKAVFDKIEIQQGPTQTEYVSGEAFNPAGMKVEISFSNGFDPIDVTNELKWGAINEGAGTCVGTFDGHSVTVTGLTIKSYVGKTWNKVTSELADYSGTYLLVNTSAHLIMNGAASDMTASSNFIEDASVFGSDVITGTKAVDDASFTITKNGDNYTIKAINGTQKYIGCGSSGIGAAASVGDNQKLLISWSTDHIEIGRIVSKKVSEVQTDVPYSMVVQSSKKFNFIESAKVGAGTLVELYKLAD